MSKFSEALITRVVVRGFRSLENVAVDFEPVTVLVGPNGTGKSSFLDALAFLQQAIYDSPQDAFQARGGIGSVLTETGQRPSTVSVEVHIQSRAPGQFSGSYFVRFRATDRRRRFSIEEETCEMIMGPERTSHRFVIEKGEWKVQVEDVSPKLAENRLALPLMSNLEYFAPMHSALTSLYLYAITPDALKAMQIPGRGDRLALDGSNAASVLRQILDTEHHHRIVQAISQIVSSVQNVAHAKRGRELTIAFTESFVGHEELSFNASSMSDGTLQVLAILLAIYQPKAPTLVGLEEPETAVHPGAAAVLAEALQEAGLRTQILVTTHSPDLITRFDVGALRAVERTDDGVTIIAPIAEAQREAIRRRLFTAGEVHRMEGLRPSLMVSEESSNDA